MGDYLERIKPSLEIEEHINAHTSGFKLQRIGLIAILSFVALAAAGLFGDGLLSKRIASHADATIFYERFYRFEGPMTFKVDLAGQEDAHVISFPSTYLKNFKIDAITPEPSSIRMRNNKIEYVFDGNGSGSVAFYLIPQKIGSVDGDIVVDASTFCIYQFIFP